ncbi:MAG: Alpha/beta hydrolase [Glaciihabitans sp.]|nr:Alpha/beta hydrolase [Glaciihabitans sp.]
MHIVLIPPLLCSPRVYAPALDDLWEYGQVSIADTRRDDTIAEMAKRILREAPDEIAIIGTSMGGYVALEVVRQAPERVTALALVSTQARSDTQEETQAREKQFELIAQGQFDALVDVAFPGIVAPYNATNLDMLATWRAMAATVGAEAYLRQLRAVMDRSDFTALLPTITCPTAIIHGADDRYIPVAEARESAAAMPTARFTIIPGAGHFVFHEQPTAASTALSELLGEVARKRR